MALLYPISHEIRAAQVGGGIRLKPLRVEARQCDLRRGVAEVSYCGKSAKRCDGRAKENLQGLEMMYTPPNGTLAGKLMINQWILRYSVYTVSCFRTIPVFFSCRLITVYLIIVSLKFESRRAQLRRTGLSFEDVCPLDGKHVPRIAVLPGSLLY